MDRDRGGGRGGARRRARAGAPPRRRHDRQAHRGAEVRLGRVPRRPRATAVGREPARPSRRRGPGRRRRLHGGPDLRDRGPADRDLAHELLDQRDPADDPRRRPERRAPAEDPVFVLYSVPDRDCGNYSKGGTSADEYLPWVRAAVRAMAGSKAVVLVEPDSIAQIQVCKRLEHDRLPLLRKAVAALAGHGLTVYLDGGNENRVPTSTMAKWLREAGVDRTQGFFTNVSNFYRVDQERAYADGLADAIGGDPHFVIDVSRNGQGWRGTWCNPDGAGLGQAPHVTRGTTRLDALLWVKTPGLSDGTCNGGPAAGQWWESYALSLVENRKR
ncbi:glycoside hydrolase family 6 protein [Curtobacterium flaccumfaciens]|nr:glycoside hydrolase family 6 protein [Curtobacterium flaccumfaciens]